MGTLKSPPWGSGGLLAMGVRDTMRVSLSADPVEEGVRRPGHPAGGGNPPGGGAGWYPAPPARRTRIDLIPLWRDRWRRAG